MSENKILEIQTDNVPQYSKKKIFFLWALVAIPMPILKYVVSPYLNTQLDMHPGIIYWWLMILGMIWQFVLSLIVLKKELGTITWPKLKARLWLNPPINPKNGQVQKSAFWLTIPVILYATVIEQFGFFGFIEESMVNWFPFLMDAQYTQIEQLMAPEFKGAWYLLIVATISSIFNYLLGEELFFRGILLPKMNGAFGRWDWVMNAGLFAAYHLHKASEIPLFIIGSIFIAFLNKRYRTFYPSLIIHGVEAIPIYVFIILFLLNII